jgi:hypothetical protein
LATNSIDKALQMQSENLIDDTANFNGAPVYIFSGNKDTFYP